MDKRKVFVRFKKGVYEGDITGAVACAKTLCRYQVNDDSCVGCKEYVLVNPQELAEVEEKAALWDRIAALNEDVVITLSYGDGHWASIICKTDRLHAEGGSGDTPQEAVKQALKRAGEQK